MSKTLIGLTVMSIVVQILFSFYYSSNIVNQNNQLDENKQKYQQLKIEISEAKKQLSQLTSIDHFLQSTPSSTLNPVYKHIEILTY